MKRVILIGVLVLVVAVAVGAYLLLSNLGSIIKAVVEKVGSDVTQVKVTLDQADVSITSGSGALRGLTVGNPAGFTSDSALKLGAISVALDLGSVQSDPIVIKEIVVQSPSVTYEFAGTGSNIETIRKNVQAYAGGGQTKPASGEGAGRRLVIDDLYVRDGRIDVVADFLKGQPTRAALPTIHLKDIGRQGGKNVGVTASEVAELVLDAIARNSTSSVGKLDVAGIQDALRGAGSAGVEKALKEGTTSAEKTVKEGAAEGVKKLFGR